MPASYTHYVFGQAVLEELSPELQRIIKENLAYYHIGVLGPDIIFYYRPFFPTPVSRFGFRMHKAPARDFFQKARETILVQHSPQLLTYIIGFITHFMLDSSCHPYIKNKMQHSKVAHVAIETELDRLLMLEDGKNPFKDSPVEHLEINQEIAQNLSLVLLPLTAKQIHHSLLSLKVYSTLLICPTERKRKFLQRFLKFTGAYESFGGLVMDPVPNPCCIDSNQHLMMILDDAVMETVKLIHHYTHSLITGETLSDRFDLNYQ